MMEQDNGLNQNFKIRKTFWKIISIGYLLNMTIVEYCFYKAPTIDSFTFVSEYHLYNSFLLSQLLNLLREKVWLFMLSIVMMILYLIAYMMCLVFICRDKWIYYRIAMLMLFLDMGALLNMYITPPYSRGVSLAAVIYKMMGVLIFWKSMRVTKNYYLQYY